VLSLFRLSAARRSESENKKANTRRPFPLLCLLSFFTRGTAVSEDESRPWRSSSASQTPRQPLSSIPLVALPFVFSTDSKQANAAAGRSHCSPPDLYGVQGGVSFADRQGKSIGSVWLVVSVKGHTDDSVPRRCSGPLYSPPRTFLIPGRLFCYVAVVVALPMLRPDPVSVSCWAARCRLP
jgi:hypothetical protein